MSLLALLLASALVQADPAPPAVEGPPPAVPASEPHDAGRQSERPLSISAGVSLLRFDDIPVTLGIVRVSATAVGSPRPDRNARFALGFTLELAGGQTERGLEVGGVVAGPNVALVADRFRAGVGLELGIYGIRRATDGVAANLLSGFFRGILEADLWRGADATLFASLTGSLGGGSDIPFRGGAGLLGLRY
jgi:hypothetical protein